MHEKDFLIGVKLVGFSIVMGVFSVFIYPRILGLLGWNSICLISPPVAGLTSLLLLVLGIVIFMISLVINEEH